MRPSWRSQQKREELIEEERRLHEEEEAARESEAQEVAQPESEPESEPCASEAEPDATAAQDGKGVGLSASEAEEEVVLPALPQEERPTLAQYREKWARLLAQHAKAVAGGFSLSNLVPLPIHELFQDCPYVPFDKLVSEDSQARLSVCKPISGLQESTTVGGVERFAHNAGDVFFRTRSPMQLASTLGFVLDKQSGQFLGLRPEELDALHEIIIWGREHGNNKILAFFGQTLEDFSDACKAVSAKFKHILPRGNNSVRVRVTAKDKVRVRKEGNLGQTLGDETTGIVVVDLDGHPIRPA